MVELQNEMREVIRVPVWDCGSHLYDSYELVSFSHLLDRHVVLVPFLKNSTRQLEGTRFCEADEAARCRQKKNKATVGRRIRKDMVKKRSKVIMSSVAKTIACWS
jgi:hypothetical protein